MPLANSKIGSIKVKQPKQRTGPVWEGPDGDGPNGGITYSLLCRFLSCRERFRLLVTEGLKATEGFNHRLEYGNMWHACEEAFARVGFNYPVIERALIDYCRPLLNKYPMDREKINHWYMVCKVQFPIYLDFWKDHRDMAVRKPLLQEYQFDIRHQLPSGKTVRLRGKWDSVDLETERKISSVILQENKTKGNVDPIAMERQLKFDLQTMMYLTALHESRYDEPLLDLIPKGAAIAGVRYNVVRRPLSGGKGTIVQHKPSKKNPRGESAEEYYTRVAQVIKDDQPHFFMRWKSEVSLREVDTFRTTCLNPILENLCAWWSYTIGEKPSRNGIPLLPPECLHWRTPYGVWNPLDEGRFADVDGYMETGSEAGLSRVDNLFPELQAAV